MSPLLASEIEQISEFLGLNVRSVRWDSAVDLVQPVVVT